jgi:nicotinamide-nucleotide amidase
LDTNSGLSIAYIYFKLTFHFKMRAEILCVGSELLLGQIIDTNAAYIATELAKIGVDLHRKQTAGDNLDRITDCIKGAISRADVLVITGGLGPTTDDLTREAIAGAVGVPLEYKEELADELKAFFERRKIPIRDTFLRQAYLPAGAKSLENTCGTAPGVWWDKDGRLIFAVPGVPREMKAMLQLSIIPILLEKMEGERSLIVSRVLRTFGVGESQLADEVEDILTTATNPTVAPLIFGNTEVHLRMTAKAKTEEEANVLLDEMEDRLRERVGRFIFGKDDQTLPQVLVDTLTGRSETLSVAESLTGGWLGSSLTEATGCSAVFMGGVIAYSPFIKEEVLKVSPADVEKYTVVSEEVAAQMARGVQEAMGTTYGLSTTGEAGPDSATGAPVGTVYIGLAHPNGVEVEKREFSGGRDAVRKRSAMAAIDLLRRFVSD